MQFHILKEIVKFCVDYTTHNPKVRSTNQKSSAETQQIYLKILNIFYSAAFYLITHNLCAQSYTNHTYTFLV